MSKLWGGRFKKKTHYLLEEFGRSIHFDHKLAYFDCVGSLAHIQVLKKAKLLNTIEYKKLKNGLEKIINNIVNKSLIIDETCEDIHTYIQTLLEKDPRVGKVALKLHTCRSRNDQVVFDTKAYCVNTGKETIKLLKDFNDQLLQLAEKKQKSIYSRFYAFTTCYTCSVRTIFVCLCGYVAKGFQSLKTNYQRN